MKHSVKLTILTVAIMLMASSMFGGSVATTNNNNITANVAGLCRFDSPLAIAFGTYDPFSTTALTGTDNVTFRCVRNSNAGNSYTIWFSKTGGNMADGAGNNLAYTLTDSVGAALPIAAPGTVVGGLPGVGGGYTFTVNGTVAINQDVPVGSYADTVVVNVEW